MSTSSSTTSTTSSSSTTSDTDSGSTGGTGGTAGSTGEMATRTLTFTGTGYTAHDTDEIWFTLWDDADNVTPVETLTTATDGMGNIDETWSMTLIDGHSYTLYWVADEMDNGTCDAPPDDHGWSESFGPVAGDVTVDYDHDGNFDNTACDNTVIE